MGLLNEFKTFATRGSVADMAVGIIIGAAFGKIVSSVVNDVIMPPLGVVIGGVNFTDLKITIKDAVPATTDALGNLVAEMPAVTLNYGNFLQVTFDFIIVALAVFMLIKGMNALKKKEEAKIPAKPAEIPKEEILLTEIRDLLKNKNN